MALNCFAHLSFKAPYLNPHVALMKGAPPEESKALISLISPISTCIIYIYRLVLGVMPVIQSTFM